MRVRGFLMMCSAICLGGAQDVLAAETRAPAAPETPVHVERVAAGLEHPWALQFLPDGRMIVSERAGRLRLIDRQGRVSQPVEGLPSVAATGQGGLLDLALAPDFGSSGMIFMTFAEARKGTANGTSVARATLVLEGQSGRLSDFKVIFRQQPESSGGLHFGSRLALTDDGRIFVTLGERYQKDYAQDLGRHWGKVIRIDQDGKAPADNPFVGQAGAQPEIWSYGHRNPQSAAIHPQTRKLWVVEHGPRGGDEVNVPERGRNYGWPVIGYGIDYSGAKLHASTHKDGMEQPIYYWVPSIAPSGMAFYTGVAFPAWTGNLFVGALAGQALHRLVLEGERVVAEEVLLKTLGERIRDVRQGPDGMLWLLTDDPKGQVLRVVPGRG